MTVRLKQLATLVAAQGSGGIRPFISLENIDGGSGHLAMPIEDIPVRTTADASSCLVETGDVLFGKLRPYLAKTWRSDRPIYASTELLALHPIGGTDSRWLYYLVSSSPVVEWAIATSEGTKMPRTSWEKLRLFTLANVPEPRIQRAIADYLDAETARIDALIAKKQRMVELLEQRAGSLLTEYFGRDHANRSLRAIAEVTVGRQRSPQHNSGAHMIRYLRAANVKDGRLELFDVMEMNFDPDEQRRFSLRFGDVLVTEGSGSLDAVGANAVWRKELTGVICFQNTLLRLRPTSLVSADFLAWWCRYAYHAGLFAAIAGGANIYHLGAERVRSIPCHVPGKDDQLQIVKDLEGAFSINGSMKSILESQIELLQERRQALITTAVTGQLNIPGVAA